jgi:protein-tyrosine phosphatase
MIDLHSHLMPGVDDGASTLEESRSALTAMAAQGVTRLVTTSHLEGSETTDPARLDAALGSIDTGWARLDSLAREEFPHLSVGRGLEVMLNTPEPDLSDPRLRLAGTSFVLVEFPYMSVPPNSSEAVFALKMKGWRPVIAHPERYAGLDDALSVVEGWRRVGGLLQVNCGSLIGRYGNEARTVAWRLLRRGWVDILASDYHARGRCHIAEARAKLEEKGAAEQAELLFSVNPGRVLADQSPEPVPPLQRSSEPIWQRFFLRR